MYMTYHDLQLKLRKIIAAESTIAPQWAKVAELSLSLKGQFRHEHELDEIPETGSPANAAHSHSHRAQTGDQSARLI
jgi:hypothetical protein